MAIPISDLNDTFHTVWPSKEDLDQQPLVLAYRPRSIEDIITKTRFKRREVQLIYRSFKQLCPSGMIQKSTFHEIFRSFFPLGNTTSYANMVFRTLDRDFNGSINFEDFVVALSAITRGTTEEKLDWIFSLYDINNKGFIGERELLLVTESVYALLSKPTHGVVAKKEIHKHSQDVFRKLTRDGFQKTIDRNQFIDTCLKDPELCNFEIFDTKL